MTFLRTLFLPLILVLGVGLAAPGCAMTDNGDDTDMPSPRYGFVQDMASFETFIQQRPTAEAFRTLYPDVQLVMPGDITTKEFRMNNSRYFAEFDEQGRIIGGRFQ